MTTERSNDRLKALREELQEIASCRTQLAVSSADTPVLDNAMRRDGATNRQKFIEQRIDGLPEASATPLALILSETDDRWITTVTARRGRAAELFGLRDDSFRKRPDGPGSSRYDALIDELAKTILESDSDPVPTRHSTTKWVIGALAVLIAVGGVLVATQGGANPEPGVEAADENVQVENVDDDAGEPETTDLTVTQPNTVILDGCSVPVGATEGARNALTPNISDPMSLFGDYPPTCPSALAKKWGDLWLQPFDEAEPPTVLLATPTNTFFVQERLFEGYRRVGGDDGTQAQANAGLPSGTDELNGHPVLLLEDGGIVISEQPGSIGRWLPPEAKAAWDDNGGIDGDLGLPLADINLVDDRPYQGFSGGFLELTDDGVVEATITDPISAKQAAEELIANGPGILRLYDQTAFFVTETGTRRWIPDADAWFCLGGDEALLTEEPIDSWVLATFELGPIATCEQQ